MKSGKAALLIFLTLGVLAVPLTAETQARTTYRVGYIASATAEAQAYLQTFRATLRTLGYLEGSNLILDVRMVDTASQIPALVAELLVLKPDVLVGWENSAQVMRAKTTSIPIVLTGAIDPIRAGLAQSLRRPGLNVTGIKQYNDELPAKHIEILREILPRLARVGQLVDMTASGCKLVEQQARQAAQQLGVVFVPYNVRNQSEIERAFSQMEKDRPEALLPCPSMLLFRHRDLLFENAVRLGIPFTSFIVANVPPGVLFAYSSSRHEEHRRAAMYVDRILNGAKPADLPIEQPTKFELVINLKTAKALGLTIPPSLLLRADRVIE